MNSFKRYSKFGEKKYANFFQRHQCRQCKTSNAINMLYYIICVLIFPLGNKIRNVTTFSSISTLKYFNITLLSRIFLFVSKNRQCSQCWQCGQCSSLYTLKYFYITVLFKDICSKVHPWGSPWGPSTPCCSSEGHRARSL